MFLSNAICFDPIRICRYHLRGECRYGNHCHYVHGLRCNRCGQNAVHPTDPVAAAAHETACARAAARKQSLITSKSAVCGICWDKPERFGLLENCTHSFCLSCIREWRTSECSSRRVCPLCRTESYLVIPSDTLETDPAIKKDTIDGYKKNLASIPCKYFAYGHGTCPFQDACLYDHTEGHDLVMGMSCLDLYGGTEQEGEDASTATE